MAKLSKCSTGPADHVGADAGLAFAEYLPDIVARFDPQFRHLYVNRAVESVTGLPAQSFLGKTNRDLGMPSELVDLWDKKLGEVFASGEPTEVRFAYDGVAGQRHIVTRIAPEFGDDGRVRSVVTVARDMTDHESMRSGIISAERRHEETRQRYAEEIENVLVHTVEALSLALEKRDPYTAGHQSRTADLALRTGRTLGLPEIQLRGIWLGALIHDIGKIFIPAEILNRPGKLHLHEFGLIKCHPEVGFDIVKDVEFPWPVAKMILQHHERIDGSGYPNGLRGDQIAIEARILAVADVVEAMTSHRPYRPALGLSEGLTEVRSKSGTHFDSQVVDALVEAIANQPF